MTLHEFIFSDARPHRQARHLAFWAGWFFLAACLQVQSWGPEEMGWGNFCLFQLKRSGVRLVPTLIFCYATTYYLVPWLFKKRKPVYFVFVALIICLFYWVTYLWFLTVLDISRITFGVEYTPFQKRFFSLYTHINFTGSIPTCCVMLTIKYYKDWYIRQRATEQLTRENKQAELQLLKAQIHPHFLFNTLNNIYSFTLTGSPLAAGLVDKLSGMIDYLASEGKEELVPLEKELQLMEDYVGLEKVRYGDRLDIQVQVNGDYKNKLIAPMLLIPFVENGFKHGASLMRGRPWIRLTVAVEDNHLAFTLSNSKPAQPPRQNGKGGIGLANVQKRLQLLYAGRHTLTMEAGGDTYQVHLQLVVQQQQPLPDLHTPTPEPKTVSYA